MLPFLILLLVGISCFAWYRPRVFSFHANVSSPGGKVSGEVFKSSDGVFLVRLNSGSQLTVQANPPTVFLSPISSARGLQIGKYLLVPAASVGGVDLTKNEGFNQQMSMTVEGSVILKDPRQPGGEFSFPVAVENELRN